MENEIPVRRFRCGAGLGRWRDSAPLWPAGHLPHAWGDWLSPRLSPISNVERMVRSAKLPISPLVGEMAGRPEGGAVERQAR
ncbi:hypothetical protein FJ964_11545 [Mesorhizobium sp. B2-3-2]|nr:hypothetical protein FJ964_11545 [Mesorhizobium sp. B2-3-2]